MGNSSRYRTMLCAALLLTIQSGWRSTAAQGTTTTASTMGQWSAVTKWPELAAHSNLLPNGTVLFWPTFGNGNTPTLYNPVTNSFTLVTPASYNIFCAGHSYTADGKILVTGGHIVSNFGFAHATLYDPSTSSWSQVPDMWQGRWYPTNTTLPNGDIVTLSGTMDPATGLNPMPEVWRHETNTWQQLFSAQLVLPYYPRMFVAPNGKLFVAGSAPTTRYLDTTGSGTWTSVGNTRFNGPRDYGSAVMYSPGKILLVGGGDPPTATVETIDLNAATPAWAYSSPMSQPRRQANATILPDGTVLVTGGSSAAGFDTNTAPVLTPELWNPATGAWTKMASSTIYRGYHSTALLLQDGRVLSAGGNDNSLYRSGEIFSPPYLFNGTRPTITSAPTSMPYGSIVNVITPDAASISQVTLISLGSVTHAFNMNQTFNNLRFSVTSTGDGLNVITPASGSIAPPGPYMLFLLNSSGVPSLGSVMTVGEATSTTGPVTLVPSSIALRAVVNTTTHSAPIAVTNNQQTAVTFSGFAVSAPFAQTNTCVPTGSQTGTLAPGATCTINISYAPTTAGTSTVSLALTDDAATSPQTVAVQGLSVLPVTISPSSGTFSKTAVGSQSSSHTFSLKNEQAVPLVISSMVLGGDFNLSFDPNNTPCKTSLGFVTVAPGYFCKFSLSFAPTVTGTRTGTLTITDDAKTSPQTVPLHGTGS
jgi:hypothetical protein